MDVQVTKLREWVKAQWESERYDNEQVHSERDFLMIAILREIDPALADEVVELEERIGFWYA